MIGFSEIYLKILGAYVDTSQKPSYRMKQTERGNEALSMFAEFLESKNGVLTVSLHESHFSSGIHSQPDIVFGRYGIEVKRVEMFVKNTFRKGDTIYKSAQLGQIYYPHDCWNRLKKWCEANRKIPLFVAVITCGRQPPIFVKLSKEELNKLQVEQNHKESGMNINVIRLLLLGEIWK